MSISKAKQDQLLDEVQDHLEQADTYLETLRSDWDDLEAMLIAKLTDDLSTTTNNTVFDPVLATQVLERSSRVMAQNPKGKAYAQSKDDVGKNMLMNLLLGYFYKNANEQDSMLIKLRMMDLYSLVYGSMFALVPWRVNERTGYTGPELNLLPIRDCFPQPTKKSVRDMDWFIVRNVVSLDWLKQQDQSTWMNINRLENELKELKQGDEATQKDGDKQSFVERSYYPGTYSDMAFPQVELYTEYRQDTWVTWTPQRVDSKTSKPYILRAVGDDKNPAYPNHELPIVAKHAFPLIDSPIGLGEFAKGKSLQMAINSLWNLYLQGVKYTVFPPLHVNPDNVVPSSMDWNPGEFWFMNNPNQDVQPMNIRPAGIETFHSTFGALKASIESQAGTSSVRESVHSRSALGKTPEAIRFLSERESSRDEWDRVMMEDTITDMYGKWVALATTKLEKDVQTRLFAEEIEDIKEVYPDVVEMFESGRGAVRVRKGDIEDTYDFVLESGSTLKPNIEEEQNNVTEVLKAVIENPNIIKVLEEQENVEVRIGQLFKRWVEGKLKDADKIIVEKEPVDTELPNEVQEAGIPEEQMAQMPQEMPQEIPQGMDQQQFQDPDIMSAYQQVIGNFQS